jgi:2-aminoethylphosphonate-pyruvate transaminase
LTRSINARLSDIYPAWGGGYQSVFMTGSGTSAIEAMLHSFAPSESSSLIVANGVYGERMAAILERQGKPHQVIASGWLQPMDLEGVARALEGAGDISHVIAVHHETTTGRLNDIEALGVLCVQHGVTLLLDAVSSFGAEAIDAPAWNVGALAATANKCLHGVPGIAFVLASNKQWEMPAPRPSSVYLDLHSYRNAQYGEGFSPFTQAVQPAFALDAALDELAAEGGWQSRQKKYLDRMQQAGDALSGAGVQMLIDPDAYSAVLRSWRLPDGLSYAALHDELRAHGYVIYAGQGNLASEIFRLSFMGDISDSEMSAFADHLVRIVSHVGQ